MKVWARRGAAAGVAVAAATVVAGPAAANLCDLRVYDSRLGVKAGEADGFFNPDAQFIVCLRVREPGFVSIWDRMPTSAPVERLAPNENYTDPAAKAVPVKGDGAEACFGTGVDGYYLLMDAKDGVGPGLFWAVFTSKVDDHPGFDTYGSVDSFETAWSSGALGKLGAGSIASGAQAPDPGTVPDGDLAACEWRDTLQYPYAVEGTQ